MSTTVQNVVGGAARAKAANQQQDQATSDTGAMVASNPTVNEENDDG